MRRKVNAHNLFVLILSVLIIFSVASVAVAMWTSNKMFLSNSFFRRGADIFMDFYNSIRDNADFFTYTERSTIYPPLVAFFFHAIGFFIPDEYIFSSFELRQRIYKCAPAAIMLLLFFGLCMWLLYISIRRLTKKENKWVSFAIFVLACFSYPLLFGVERGNILILSAILLLFFLAFGEDERKWVRELSLIMFAVSIVIKIYPVVFSLILLKKKRWMDFIRLALYSVLLFFVPFIFYGGSEGLALLVTTVTQWSSSQVSAAGFSGNLAAFLTQIGVDIGIGADVLKLAAIVYLACLIPFLKKDYELVLVCSLMLMRIPGTGAVYSCLYFLPVLLMLLRDRDKYALVYLVPLFFINFLFGFYNETGILYQYFFLWSSLVCFVILGLSAFLPRILKAKMQTEREPEDNQIPLQQEGIKKGGITHKVIRFVIPAALFLISFIVAVVLSKRYFASNFLVVDDGREYALFLKSGFLKYVFPNARPVAAFFMGIGFALFGASWNSWVFYVGFFVGCLIVAFYILLRTMKSHWASASLLSLAFLLSRLNWYFYACCFGVMESVALAFCLLGFAMLCRYLKNSRWLWYGLSLLFFLLSALSHERYFPLLFIPSILAIFRERGWAKKTFVSLAGFCGLGLFFVYRFVAVRGPLFRVTGNSKFETNFGALIANAWHVFSNSVSLNEPIWYMSGITNSQLGFFSKLAFAFSGLLFGATTILSFAFIFVSYKKKQSARTLYLLALWLAFLALLAASSTTARSETRWEYSVFTMILLLFVTTVQFAVSLLPKEDNGIRKSKSARFWSATIPMVFAVAITSFTGIYSLQNKEHFYINDSAARADGFYQGIYLPFRDSGKEKLVICTDDFNRYEISYLPLQWGNQENLIINKSELYSGEIDLANSFVAVLNEYDITILPNASSLSIHDIWTEQEYEFDVIGDTSSLTTKIMETIFPVEEPNGITIYVNEKAVVDHAVLDQTIVKEIPLELGKINHVKFVPDYTYNPSKEGTGTDIRDLGVYIVELHA